MQFRLDPPNVQLSSIAAVRLRKVSYQLFIRLPRLIALVRILRDRTDMDYLCHVLALTEQLSALKDADSENQLLHAVNFTKTRHPADACIIPVSFRFNRPADFRTMVYYWQTSVLLQRLCCKLHYMFPDQADIDPEAAKADTVRMSSNLLMSWEYAYGYSAFGAVGSGAGANAFGIAMIALWGCLADVDTFRGQSSAMTRAWVLYRFQDLLRGAVKLSAEDMDEMAELFVGGPVSGVIPRLFDSSTLQS